MKIFVWTDNDLDGAGCALALKHLYKDKATQFDVKEIDDSSFIGSFKAWSTTLHTYDKVFITDLGIPDELVSYVDVENVIIIDHHKTHIDKRDRYKKAKVILKEYTSCSLLIHDTFNKGGNLFTPEVQELLFIIDDYDSYTLKYPDTLKYNAIFSHYNRPRVDKFIENFYDGKREFTAQELNCIKLSFNRLKEQLNTDFFTGTLKGYSVVSCFADYAINEVAHFTLKKFNADIAFIVNLKSKSVSIRRAKTCDAKLSIIAEKICNGGGHEYAAGGKITETFLNFTKLLKPCSN